MTAQQIFQSGIREMEERGAHISGLSFYDSDMVVVVGKLEEEEVVLQFEALWQSGKDGFRGWIYSRNY